MKRTAFSLAYATLLALGVGCSTNRPEAPDPVTDLNLPQSWGTKEVSETAVSDGWIVALNDPELESLFDEAIEGNFGIAAAEARTRSAEAAARLAGSNRLPSLALGGQASKQQAMITYEPPVSTVVERPSLQLSSQWEVDLWGRLAQSHKASKASYQASLHDLDSLKTSLVGQVAKAWYDAIEAKRQYFLAKQSLASFETTLETLEMKYQRGLIESLDLRLTRTQAAQSRISAVERKTQYDATIRRLETLLGRYPAGTIKIADELPDLPAHPPAGIPADLLLRRPDLLAEQQRLAAQVALDKNAQRNWLPSITLTGSDGRRSNGFSQLLDSDFKIWSIAADLGLSLYQGGRLKAQRSQARANLEAEIANYLEVALAAFREVETALVREENLAELETEIRIAAEETQASEEQAWNQYNRGLIDISSALDAERRNVQTQGQLITVVNRRLQNRIDLHIALGGPRDPVSDSDEQP